MRITLDYGRDGLDVEVPDANLAGILSMHAPPALDDPVAAIRAALDDPIGAAPLGSIAQGRRDACIVVCDITRPVPNPVILPPILRALKAAGIPAERVTILIATGTHRSNNEEELTRMLGSEAMACTVVNSVCTDGSAFRDLGVSENGVPIWLHKQYLDADLKITIGMIEPHYMAGYAGGRKMVMPGIAALATIQAWHSPKFLEHPNATMGATVGNPVHEEALKIALLAKPDFIVDVALDVRKRICAVFAGDMERAWEAGVRFVSGNVFDFLDEPVDAVVTTCGGFPLDLTFYQSVKGMVGALPILKPGGTVILASQMAEGVGLPHFEQALLNTVDIESYPEQIVREGWQFVGDQWQVEELSKAVRASKILVKCDGISSDLLGRLFVTPIDSVEAGIAHALERHGPQATIAVIPKGPYVIPAIRSRQAA